MYGASNKLRAFGFLILHKLFTVSVLYKFWYWRKYQVSILNLNLQLILRNEYQYVELFECAVKKIICFLLYNHLPHGKNKKNGFSFI